MNRTVCRPSRQDSVKVQTWGKIQENFCTIESAQGSRGASIILMRFWNHQLSSCIRPPSYIESLGTKCLGQAGNQEASGTE